MAGSSKAGEALRAGSSGYPAPVAPGGTAVIALSFGYPWRRLAIGLGVATLVGVLAAGVGSVGMPPFTVVKILASRIPVVDITPTWPDTWDTILWQLRLPRIVLAQSGRFPRRHLRHRCAPQIVVPPLRRRLVAVTPTPCGQGRIVDAVCHSAATWGAPDASRLGRRS